MLPHVYEVCIVLHLWIMLQSKPFCIRMSCNVTPSVWCADPRSRGPHSSIDITAIMVTTIGGKIGKKSDRVGRRCNGDFFLVSKQSFLIFSKFHDALLTIYYLIVRLLNPPVDNLNLRFQLDINNERNKMYLSKLCNSSSKFLLSTARRIYVRRRREKPSFFFW